MFGTPSNVPLVGYRALIAPVSYALWLLGAVGGLSIPHRARGVKRVGPHLHSPHFASLASRWRFKKNISVHYPLSESMYLSSNTRESSEIPRNSSAVR